MPAGSADSIIHRGYEEADRVLRQEPVRWKRDLIIWRRA